MIRKLVVVAVTAAAALVAVQAAPASADGYCPSGRVCMWEDPRYQGDRWVDTTVGGPGWFYDIDWWNGDDELSSIDNATGAYIHLYKDDYASSSYLCVRPHSRMPALSVYNLRWDNNVESFSVQSSCAAP